MSEVTTVELRPGQQVVFITEGVQVTPFGRREVKEVKETFTYEQIIERLKRTMDPGVSESKSRVPRIVREFNRYSTVALTGLTTGKWMKGTIANPVQIVEDLMLNIKNLPQELYSFVSDKAKNNLAAIAEGQYLSDEQKSEVQALLEAAAV